MAQNQAERLKKWVADKKNWKRFFGPLLCIAVLFTAARVIDLNHYLQIGQKWIWQFGPCGPVAFVGLYTMAVLFLLPGLPFTLMAAFLFGSLKGYLVMMVASTLAAIVGFTVARYLARETFERRLRAVESFEKLTDLVEKNQWLVISFIRLMPIFPFSLNNYVLGLTNVPFWRYLLFSEIVFIPMNALWIFGANTIYAAMISGEISWSIMGAAFTAGLLVLALGYAGKRVFAQSVASADP
jgi:uncharacterized membrane protein YdjX (TVP38/TMEM64 family)